MNRLTRRDKALLTITLFIALIFLCFYFVFIPMRNRNLLLETEISNKNALLVQEQINLERLPVVIAQQKEVSEKIENLVANFLPDRTPQFYLDLLIKKAETAGLKITSASAQTLSSLDITPPSGNKGEISVIEDIILNYSQAVNGTAEEGASSEAVEEGTYVVNAIGVALTFTSSSLASVQRFQQSIDDLNYSVYISSYNTSVNEEGLETSYSIYFVSVSRLGDFEDNETYNTITPAGKADIFAYEVQEDLQAETEIDGE